MEGVLYLTTPNIANWSNILALIKNKNVFWHPIIFYGGVDRHNREWTSEELRAVLLNSGFKDIQIKFYNTISNWSAHLSGQWQRLTRLKVPQIPILNNTILAIAAKADTIKPLTPLSQRFYFGSHYSILNPNTHKRRLHRDFAAKIHIEQSEFSNNKVKLKVLNAGKRKWTKSTNLRIGASGDHNSTLYHPSWISRNRICTFSEEQAKPQEIATFDFEIVPSGQAEDFELVVEEKLWLPNSYMF